LHQARIRGGASGFLQGRSGRAAGGIYRCAEGGESIGQAPEDRFLDRRRGVIEGLGVRQFPS